MKRSEMLKILKDSFWKHMNSEECLTDDDMYHQILADIERAGMLPPKIEPIKPGTFYRACEYFKTCEKGIDGSCGGCNGPASRRNAVWEPED